MNVRHKEFLDRLEATLKARRVARDFVESNDLGLSLAKIAERHEEALDEAVMALCNECAEIANETDQYAPVELRLSATELRYAAICLIKRIG